MTGIKTKKGKNIMLNRMYKPVPDYTVPSQFKVGTGTTQPVDSDIDLELSIPIGFGTTNDDGSNTLTGSLGGSNTTNNTIIFKPGAGLSDNTAQNLIANDTDDEKVWTIADLSMDGNVADEHKITELWIYINNDVTLAKLADTGTAIEIKIGEDSSNYYYKEFEKSDLILGWNRLYLGVLDTNSVQGTIAGTLDFFEIVITTNLSTDKFAAGDVVYDLLRQYEETDTLKNFSSVFLNENDVTATITAELFSTQAVGYNISEIGTFNTDSTPSMDGRDVFSGESKSSEDEFKFTIIDGLD